MREVYVQFLDDEYEHLQKLKGSDMTWRQLILRSLGFDDVERLPLGRPKHELDDIFDETPYGAKAKEIRETDDLFGLGWKDKTGDKKK